MASSTEAPEKEAGEHAWSWFSLHATQRLQMLNFWVVSVAFLTAGYVTAVGDGNGSAAFAIGVAGAVMSFCFSCLERRSRDLIRLGESAVDDHERWLESQTGNPSIRLIREAESVKGRFNSYGRVIRVLQWSATAAFVLACLLGPFAAAGEGTEMPFGPVVSLSPF